MGTYLSKEDIFAADDLRTEEVKVPEWGGVVRIRELSGTELDAYQASMMTRAPNGDMVPSMGNMRAKLVTRSIIDDDGNPVFNELDIGRLGQKSGVALGRVYERAAELSGITKESEDAAGKDFGSDQNDGSTST